MMEEDSFLRGDEVLYEEEGTIYRVRVLNNFSTKNYIGYELKIISVLRKGLLGREDDEGKEIKCIKRRDFACPGIWRVILQNERNEYLS